MQFLPLTARQYGEVVLPDASIRAESWFPAPAGPICCHGARRVWRGFCNPGTMNFRIRRGRGTMLIGASKQSRYRSFIKGTCAVSRYKVDRRQELVKVQDLNWEHKRESGCNKGYEFYLSQPCCGMMINGQREKNVRAAKPLMVFSRLAFTSPGKNHDKQLTHIVRVRFSYLFINESTSDFNFGR